MVHDIPPEIIIEDVDSERDGRHLRSSNDVFNFVKNNLSEGVNKAKQLKKDVEKVAPGPTKALENKIGEVIKDQKWLEPVVKPIEKIAKIATPKPAATEEVPEEPQVEIVVEPELVEEEE